MCSPRTMYRRWFAHLALLLALIMEVTQIQITTMEEMNLPVLLRSVTMGHIVIVNIVKALAPITAE